MGVILLFGQNQVSETICSNFIRSDSPYQLYNLKIWLTVWSHKSSPRQNSEFEFFFLSGKPVIAITRKNQVWLTLCSYINLLMKFLIKSWNSPKKQGKITFFRKRYLTFASDGLFIFSGFIVPQGIILQVKEKTEFNLF